MKLIFYTNQAGALYLTKIETTSADVEIVLPGRINGQVYNIGACAFYGNEHIEKIVIPEEVQAIGAYAFGKCSKLTHLLFEREFPPSFDYDSFTYLNRLVTCECYKGSGVYYTNAYCLTADYDSAKKSYTNINHYENNIVKERRNVLPLQYAGEQLSQIVIGDGVTSIGEMAYMGSIDVSADEDELEQDAPYFSIDNNQIFQATGERKRLLYEIKNEKNKIIAAASTYNCEFVNELPPGNLVYTHEITWDLGKNALYNRAPFITGNDSAILYLNGSKIDSLALQNVPGVSWIIIGKNVEYIADNAFFNMPHLTKISCENGQDNYNTLYQGTILFDKNYTKILWANNITDSVQATNVGWSIERLQYILNTYSNISVIPPYFCQNIFNNCTESDNIVFPSNIKAVGFKAFENAKFSYTLEEDVEVQQGAFAKAKRNT